MSCDLIALRDMLLKGIKSSMQSSYARRSPATKAVPYLEEARRGLRHFVEEDPKNVEAWRLLSQAEECLLNYPAAIACLEQVMELSTTRRKEDLKRLALLKGLSKEWHDLLLTPDQLQDLGVFLVQSGAQDEVNGRTLRFTRQWLRESQLPNDDAIIEALKRRGGHTDFQVLHNVVRG